MSKNGFKNTTQLGSDQQCFRPLAGEHGEFRFTLFKMDVLTEVTCKRVRSRPNQGKVHQPCLDCIVQGGR